MGKIHTRTKRMHDLTRSTNHRSYFHKNEKIFGAKTFKNKEDAEKYKVDNKIEGAIVPAKKNKRWKIEK